MKRLTILFTLMFTYVGMKTVEEIIEGCGVIDATLEQDVFGLEEVVVTYVNMVRIRARDGNRVMGLCTSYELNRGVVPVVDYTQEAANYDVQPYPAFASADYARKAVLQNILKIQ